MSIDGSIRLLIAALDPCPIVPSCVRPLLPDVLPSNRFLRLVALFHCSFIRPAMLLNISVLSWSNHGKIFVKGGQLRGELDHGMWIMAKVVRTIGSAVGNAGSVVLRVEYNR